MRIRRGAIWFRPCRISGGRHACHKVADHRMHERRILVDGAVRAGAIRERARRRRTYEQSWHDGAGPMIANSTGSAASPNKGHDGAGRCVENPRSGNQGPRAAAANRAYDDARGNGHPYKAELVEHDCHSQCARQVDR